MNNKLSLQFKNDIKMYSGNCTELAKPSEEPIVGAAIESDIYNEANSTVTQITTNDVICAQGVFFTVYPIQAGYTEGGWKVQKNAKLPEVAIPSTLKITENDLLEEQGFFREESNGLLAMKDEEVLYLITNIRIRIRARIRYYEDEANEPTEHLECLLYYEAWQAPKKIEVLCSEFKNLYSTLKMKFPELYLSVKARDRLDKYLSVVYCHCRNSWREEERMRFAGWSKIGGSIRYVIGDDPVYKGYYLPEVSGIHKCTTFMNGFRFLEIGFFQASAVIPFLFAHFAYLQYFAKQAQHEFESVLFMCGESNSKKTSVASVFSNVFCLDRKKKITFGTTPAALYTTLSNLRDQTILLDDYSCSEKHKKNVDTQLFEMAIRAIGDSTAPAKMNSGKVEDREFRATLVVTGEDIPPLSASSHFRMIHVFVNKTSYDGKVLGEFQRDPEMMRNYMACFIEYLRIHEVEIISFFCSMFKEKRAKYESVFQIDRMRDAAINLMMVGEIISMFAEWCGVTDRGIHDYIESFETCIVDSMLETQQENQGLEPEYMFIYGLTQLLGVREKIRLADDENQYVAKESDFIGFKDVELDAIWVRHEDASKVVKQYWDNEEKSYAISTDKLLKVLYQRGISIGREAESGKVEHLKRAKKGRRKWMLVIKEKKVQEILQKNKKWSELRWEF